MLTYNESLGLLLRQTRKTCGFTQRDVAAKLHMDRSTYVYYECGRILPDIPTLRELAAIYSIPVENLVYAENFVTEAEPGGPDT